MRKNVLEKFFVKRDRERFQGKQTYSGIIFEVKVAIEAINPDKFMLKGGF